MSADLEQGLSMLPNRGFVREYVEYAASQTDAPVLYHIGTALSLLGMLAPKDYGIHSFGSRMHGYNYVYLVGPSADRKTAAMKIGMKLLEEVYPECIGSEPESKQALHLMLQHQEQLIIFYTDLGSFLAQAKGNGHLKPLKEEYTKAYDGENLSSKSSKREISVNAPRLSVLGAVTPAQLNLHLEAEDMSTGYLSRFMILASKRETFKALGEAPENLKKRGRVLQLMGDLRGFSTFNGAFFLPEAEKAFDDWEREFDVGIRSSTDDAHAAMIARTPTKIRKVAMLLALDLSIYDHMVSRRASGEPAENTYMAINSMVEPPLIQIGMEAFESAHKIGMRSNQCALQLKDQLTHNNYLRQKASVLKAFPTYVPGVAQEAIPLGRVISVSHIERSKVLKVLYSMQEEGIIHGHEVPLASGKKTNYYCLARDIRPDWLRERDALKKGERSVFREGGVPGIPESTPKPEDIPPPLSTEPAPKKIDFSMGLGTAPILGGSRWGGKGSDWGDDDWVS